jgi:hypothetical protein
MPIEFKDDVKYWNGLGVSLGGRYRITDFNIAARVDVLHLASYTVGEYGDPGNGRPVNGVNDKATDPVVIEARICPTYNGLGAVAFGLDLGFRYTSESKLPNGDGDKKANTKMGFGAFVKSGFSNGSIKTGVTYTLAPLEDGKVNGQSVLQIPVALEYSFF